MIIILIRKLIYCTWGWLEDQWKNSSGPKYSSLILTGYSWCCHSTPLLWEVQWLHSTILSTITVKVLVSIFEHLIVWGLFLCKWVSRKIHIPTGRKVISPCFPRTERWNGTVTGNWLMERQGDLHSQLQGSPIPGPLTGVSPWLIGNWAMQTVDEHAKLHLHMCGIRLHTWNHLPPHCCCHHTLPLPFHTGKFGDRCPLEYLSALADCLLQAHFS